MKTLLLSVFVLLVMSEVLAIFPEPSEEKSSKREKDAGNSKEHLARGTEESIREEASEVVASVRPSGCGNEKACISDCHCHEDNTCCVATHQPLGVPGKCQPLREQGETCLVSNQGRDGMKEDYCQCGPGLICVTRDFSDPGVCKRTCDTDEDCPDSYCCLILAGGINVCTAHQQLDQACVINHKAMNGIWYGFCPCYGNLTCIAEGGKGPTVCKQQPCDCPEGECCIDMGAGRYFCQKLGQNGSLCTVGVTRPETGIYRSFCPCGDNLSCMATVWPDGQNVEACVAQGPSSK